MNESISIGTSVKPYMAQQVVNSEQFLAFQITFALLLNKSKIKANVHLRPA